MIVVILTDDTPGGMVWQIHDYLNKGYRMRGDLQVTVFEGRIVFTQMMIFNTTE